MRFHEQIYQDWENESNSLIQEYEARALNIL